MAEIYVFPDSYGQITESEIETWPLKNVSAAVRKSWEPERIFADSPDFITPITRIHRGVVFVCAEIKKLNSVGINASDLWSAMNDRLVFSTMKYELIWTINENFTFHEADLQIGYVIDPTSLPFYPVSRQNQGSLSRSVLPQIQTSRRQRKDYSYFARALWGSAALSNV